MTNITTPSNDDCPFCAIARHEAPASIVHEDALTMAFVGFRQFNPGHVLVIARAHFHDVGELDAPTGAALMATVARITRAVGRAFPNEGISLWSSIGPAAWQEVPHLHIHVHPRRTGDGMLDVYPDTPPTPARDVLDAYAAQLRRHLD